MRIHTARGCLACLFLAMCAGCAPSIAPTGAPSAPIAATDAPTATPMVSATATPAASATKSPVRVNYADDAAIVVRNIEAVHPSFALGEVSPDYEPARAAYLAETAEPMTRTDFLLATQRYRVALRDGHMGGSLLDRGEYLDVAWGYDGSALFLLDETGALSDARVVQVGGVPVEDVFAQVDAHIYSENDAARSINYEIFARQREMLTLAGCEGARGMDVAVERAGTTEDVACGFVVASGNQMKYGSTAYTVKTMWIDDILLIDLRECNLGDEVDAACDAIERAMREGKRRFIIDVRGNPGGNTRVNDQLLAAMDMKSPSFGGYWQTLEQTAQGYRVTAHSQAEPSLETAQPNPDVDLVVLTDRATFSAATDLACVVQDGELGTIIGQPSANAPTSYGDGKGLMLPKSGVSLYLSYKKFLRPDPDADPTTVWPDIPVALGQDALDVAIDFLKKR